MNTIEGLESLWVEKYRPQNLDDIILSDFNRKKFQEYKEEGEIPHLLVMMMSLSLKEPVWLRLSSTSYKQPN